jgi:hypothetical protein
MTWRVSCGVQRLWVLLVQVAARACSQRSWAVSSSRCIWDVEHLLLQLGTAFGDFAEHAVELFEVAARGVVQLDQLAALGQRKPMRLPRRISLRVTLSRAE